MILSSHSPMVTIVVVLYHCAATESAAVLSLQQVLQVQPDERKRVNVVLYDNSPLPGNETIPQTSVNVEYAANPQNGGLACAYEYAFRCAQKTRSAWLLLLDQDTVLSEQYWSLMFSSMEQNLQLEHVAAIVPFLEKNGKVLSPEETFSYHLRHQFPRLRYYALQRNTVGLQTRTINAFNSGAALKVTALLAANGIPTGHKLDYLDHAIFRALQRKGYLIYILPCALQQAFSHLDLASVPYSRHQSVLAGQIRFVSTSGVLLDRFLLRIWLLRQARFYRRVCSDPRVWRIMLRGALAPWPA